MGIEELYFPVYIGIMHACNIDDLYNTGWMDPPGIAKTVYIIVCTCIHAS